MNTPDFVKSALAEGRAVTLNPDGTVTVSASQVDANPFAGLPEYDQVTGKKCDWRNGMNGKPVDANREPDYHGWRGR